MRRIVGSLVVFVISVAAVVVVGGPGIAKRVGALRGHATAGTAVHGQEAAAPPATMPSPDAGADLGSLPAPTATPTPPPAKPAPASTPSPATGASPGGSAAERQLAQAVLQAINADRAAAGLAPLQLSVALGRSARQHDLAMAAADRLSHQLPGEADLGTRETRQGVRWSWAGENIGFTTNQSTGGALGIHRSMMAETPPDDGHRRNILTTTGTMVGVDVVLDSRNRRLWLTEDFAKV